jgi:hypothetical protein
VVGTRDAGRDYAGFYKSLASEVAVVDERDVVAAASIDGPSDSRRRSVGVVSHSGRGRERMEYCSSTVVCGPEVRHAHLSVSVATVWSPRLQDLSNRKEHTSQTQIP